MSHEMVFVKNGRVVAEGTEGAVALMIYRLRDGQGLPWHTYGQGSETPFTVEEVCERLMADQPVEVRQLTYLDDQGIERMFHSARASTWMGLELGSVGPEYNPLQNRDFLVESLTPWTTEGHEIETAGLLRGGAVIWAQVAVNHGLKDKDLTIRKDDMVKPYAMFCHSHDESIGLLGGSCLERVVCRNTLRMALSEGGFFRKKHYGAQSSKDKQGGISAAVLKVVKTITDEVEKFRFLESKKVKGAGDIYSFVERIQGRSGEIENLSTFKPGRVHAEVENKFRNGIGNAGKTFWDLLNAWTERSTHDLGNEKNGESQANRVARRLDAQWFGTVASSNVKAMNVALDMAKAA